MAEKTYTVQQVADLYNVTKSGVYYWMRNGLPYEKERVLGRKERAVIKLKDVENHLKLTKK